MSLNISICCSHDLFAEGIRQLLADDARKMGCRVGIVNAEEQITAKTDLLIVDYHALSNMAFETLFQHKVRILLLLTDCIPNIQDQRLFEYISKGLVGVLFSRSDSTQLKKAIHCAVSGELWFTHKKLNDIITCMKNGQMEFDVPLTRREKEIVQSICKGYSNKEIMKLLNISEPSVKKFLGSIYKKVGVTDRLQLALYAMKYWPFYFTGT
ncbi:MAG: response regulator transcription factor [Candidatus Brocadiaceae bacterium]|nr:response regulator transcription factor [Candidatus Brocadiaceae bacterium]